MRKNENSKLGYREGVVSVLLNLFLFVLKYYAGEVSSSVALIADAWHTLSDSLTSVVVILGLRLSSKQPDPEHPFGHGRWEQVAAVIIAILLAIVGWRFIEDSIAKLTVHESARYGVWAYAATLASIVLKEGLARYAFHIARLTKNMSVKADGWHHRSDALSSVMVLAGLFLNPYVWWMDSALGVLVSLMLFYAAYGIIREAVNKILGEKPSEAVIADVKRIVREEMGEEAYPHHFHIHNYGDHTEFTLHVKVPGEQTVWQAHGLATRVEQRIASEKNMDVTIHIEPLDADLSPI